MSYFVRCIADRHSPIFLRCVKFCGWNMCCVRCAIVVVCAYYLVMHWNRVWLRGVLLWLETLMNNYTIARSFGTYCRFGLASQILHIHSTYATFDSLHSRSFQCCSMFNAIVFECFISIRLHIQDSRENNNDNDNNNNNKTDIRHLNLVDIMSRDFLACL